MRISVRLESGPIHGAIFGQSLFPRPLGAFWASKAGAFMEPTIFKFVMRYSRRQQIQLLVITLLSFPFLYYSLELPKIIINDAIGGNDFPVNVLGYDLQQIPFLMVLCSVFLALVLANGGFKFFLNVYAGIVGERMLRRLRYQLLERVLRFPLPHFRKLSQGEIVSMITAETEPLGGYIGDAVKLPVFQGGTLLTLLFFMFVQDWILGLAAVALYPLQMYLIPKLQKELNRLKKARVVKVRKLSERIGETVTIVQEIHAHDTSRFELADFSEQLHQIFDIRYKIYKRKFFIKFLNNFIAQITPFFFFSIGGYLVIRGELTFGALVAVLAAYKDLSNPWKELLNFYQIKEDVRIKYDMLSETFQVPEMLPDDSQEADPVPFGRLSGMVTARNLSVAEEAEGEQAGAARSSFEFGLQCPTAISGLSGSGKNRLARLIANLQKAASGSVRIGEHIVADMPETVTGRQIAYVSQEPKLKHGSLKDNLFYVLKHRPFKDEGAANPEVRAARQLMIREAELTGNSSHDPAADWIDYTRAGIEGPGQLAEIAMRALHAADLDQDVYKMGLQGRMDVKRHPELANRVLMARRALQQRLRDKSVAPLVELFNAQKYNANMSVAENVLFGTPKDGSFDIDDLPTDPYMRKVLHEMDLMNDFLEIGRQVAALMVDLFADVEPDSEMFQQFSFISAEDLPAFRSTLGRVDGLAPDVFEKADRDRLLSLPFKLTPARHRLGLIDEPMKERLLQARRVFGQGFGKGCPEVDFFDAKQYNETISVQDNILFGRLAYGKARSVTVVGELLEEVVEELDLKPAIMEVGLEYNVGIGGARLPATQRQKLAIARAVIKQSDLLIVDEATATLDSASERRIMDNLLHIRGHGGLIWILQRAALAKAFANTVVLKDGKVTEVGTFDYLAETSDEFKSLLAAG